MIAKDLYQKCEVKQHTGCFEITLEETWTGLGYISRSLSRKLKRRQYLFTQPPGSVNIF